jgi:hypothetical protein
MRQYPLRPDRGSPRCSSVSGADVRFDEDVEYLADGALLSDRYAQRQVSLDLVAVAPAVPGLDDIAAGGEVGDDAVGAAFGDVGRRGDVAEADPGSWANTRGMVGKEAPQPSPQNLATYF